MIYDIARDCPKIKFRSYDFENIYDSRRRSQALKWNSSPIQQQIIQYADKKGFDYASHCQLVLSLYHTTKGRTKDFLHSNETLAQTVAAVLEPAVAPSVLQYWFQQAAILNFAAAAEETLLDDEGVDLEGIVQPLNRAFKLSQDLHSYEAQQLAKEGRVVPSYSLSKDPLLLRRVAARFSPEPLPEYLYFVHFNARKKGLSEEEI